MWIGFSWITLLFFFKRKDISLWKLNKQTVSQDGFPGTKTVLFGWDEYGNLIESTLKNKSWNKMIKWTFSISLTSKWRCQCLELNFQVEWTLIPKRKHDHTIEKTYPPTEMSQFWPGNFFFMKTQSFSIANPFNAKYLQSPTMNASLIAMNKIDNSSLLCFVLHSSVHLKLRDAFKLECN